MNASRCFDRLLVVALLVLLQASVAVATTIYDGFGDQFVDGYVYATTYFNGDLIAGGNFAWAGGATGSQPLARWNGTSWVGMNMPGGGYTGPGVPPSWNVQVMTVYKGELIVGGNISRDVGAPSDNILRWDGANWRGLRFGVGGTVYSLLSLGNDLYVGGHFRSGSNVLMNYIGRWDGTNWNAVGAGLSDSPLALIEYGGEIVAGGYFILGGDTVQVAAWNGNNWHAVGQTMGTGSSNIGYVTGLAVFNGVLVAAGNFTLAGGFNLAWLDGNTWKPLGGGTDGSVEALAVAGGRLYVGGPFSYVGSGATAVQVNRVASWDGIGWSPLTSGVEGVINFQYPQCLDLTANGTEVVVGGRFEFAGGLDAPNLAIWNGSAWSNVPSNYSKGLNGPTKALLNSAGALIVGGSFTWAGGHPANRIAKWNGAWTVYGSGFDNGQVNALADLNGSIVAAGTFTLSGAQSVNRIAMWNVTSWTPLGSGLGSTVYALAVYNGEVIAGGSFTTAGGSTALRVARWDGTAWHAMGAGLSDVVRTLVVYNGGLYAGGYFGLGGGFARWNGSSWVGIGFQGPATSMAISNGQLFVCGPNSLIRFNGTTSSSVNRPTVGPDYIADYFGLLVGSGGLSLSSADYGVLAVVPGTDWYMIQPATGINLGPMLAHDGNFAKGLFVGGDFVQMGGVPSRGIALLNPELKSTAIPEDPVYSRLQASPNPFQRSLSIRFSLEVPADVEVTVFDVAGRRVAKVLDGNLPAGSHEASWNGRDSRGERVRAGTYFIRARQGDRVESRQVVLIE